jgi:hypothetical protein
MTLQVFGADASGIHSPGTHLNLVPVTLFSALEGFKLYELQASDNLTTIARQQGQNTTAEDVFQTNRDRINNPNLIFRADVPCPAAGLRSVCCGCARQGTPRRYRCSDVRVPENTFGVAINRRLYGRRNLRSSDRHDTAAIAIL